MTTWTFRLQSCEALTHSTSWFVCLCCLHCCVSRHLCSSYASGDSYPIIGGTTLHNFSPLRGCSRRWGRFRPGWHSSQHTPSTQKKKWEETLAQDVIVQAEVPGDGGGLPWNRAEQLWWRQHNRRDLNPPRWHLHRLQHNNPTLQTKHKNANKILARISCHQVAA